MNKETLEYVIQKTHELIEAQTCCAELKEAAQGWLDVAGTDKESEAAQVYVAEMEEDIVTVDGLIAFAESEAGKKVFGDHAEGVASHAKKIKAEGAKYCDCPACSAVAELLEKKDCILKA